MAVTGLPRFYVGALIAGQKFVWRVIERDRDLESALLDAETTFWRCVEELEPPTVRKDDAYPETTRVALSRLYPTAETETTVELDGDLLEVIDQRRFVAASIKDLEHVRDSLDNLIRAALGENEVGLIGGRAAATWKVQTRRAVNLARLREEDPETAEKFTDTTTLRVLRVP